MSRTPAPDENTRWENWNDTVRYVKKLIETARDYEGKSKDNAIKQAQNALDGVPSAHPDKSSLQREIDRL